MGELRRGAKRGHWMWFVFPQLKGLGHSSMAEEYGIASLAEAQEYLRHPTLGTRLVDCTRLVNQVENRSVSQIFGSPDDLKFRSSMTLFTAADPHQTDFQAALDRYYGGVPDQRTLALLSAQSS